MNIYPSQIQIETVAGYCNSRCSMCPLTKSIRKEIMSDEMFSVIMCRLEPIREHIKIINLLGLGETLLDTGVAEKIRIAKLKKYPEVGIFTNGMNLDHYKTTQLLNAGIDTIVFSIDAFNAKTHDSIRDGLSLKRIIKNIDFLLHERERKKKIVKIIIRFTRQEKNAAEWPEFLKFWMEKLSKKHGDAVYCYDVHNAGYNLEGTEIIPENIKCSEVYNRMIIFSNGEIGLCCGDQFGHLKIGNILTDDPVELYNHAIFQEYRGAMDSGNISSLELCRKCTVPISILNSKHIFAENN